MKRSSFLVASLVAGSFAYSGGAAAQADSVEAGEKLYLHLRCLPWRRRKGQAARRS